MHSFLIDCFWHITSLVLLILVQLHFGHRIDFVIISEICECLPSPHTNNSLSLSLLSEPTIPLYRVCLFKPPVWSLSPLSVSSPSSLSLNPRISPSTIPSLPYKPNPEPPPHNHNSFESNSDFPPSSQSPLQTLDPIKFPIFS